MYKYTILFLFSFVIGIVPSKASERVLTTGNDYFEIAALDFRSLSYVNELSTFSAEIAARYLDRKGMAYPRPILVTLRPQAYVNFSGDYHIRIGLRNAVELDIKWHEGLTLKSCCHALCEALLKQYTLFNHGPERLSRLRAWPVAALSYEVYLGLRPATFSNLVNRAREQNSPRLETVFQLTYQGMSNLDISYGYWALEAMKAQGINRRIIRDFFQGALSGEDISGLFLAELNTAVRPVIPVDLETWWEEILETLINRDYEVVETMTDSRLWLAEFAQFPATIEFENDKYSLNLRSIWKYRAYPAVRTLLSARRDILVLRMTRINPAYYNSAYSLLKVFNCLLNGEDFHKYLHSLTAYLSDWEDVKDMQEIIEDIIVRK